MMRRGTSAALLFFCVFVASGSSAAGLDPDAAYARSLAAVGTALPDGRFATADGRNVTLAEFRGRPLILSFVYTSCPDTCSVITRQLARVIDVAREAVGDDAFDVITVGFDSQSDSPTRMRSFARKQGVAGEERWTFLSGDAASVKALTTATGFSFEPSPRGFDHVAQISVIDPEGRVYRQVYGDLFDPPALVEPLKELTFGRRALASSLSGWIDGVKLLCTIYDPVSGRYSFDYSIFISATIGLACLGWFAMFAFRAWRGTRRPGQPVPGSR